MNRGIGLSTLLLGALLSLAPRPAVDNSVDAISATDGSRAQIYRDFKQRFGGDEVIAARLEAESLPALVEATEELGAVLDAIDPVERLLGPEQVYPDALLVMGEPDLFDPETRARVQAKLQGPLGRSLGLLSLEPPTALVFAFARIAPPPVWRAAKQELDALQTTLEGRGVEMVFAGSPLLNLALDREGETVERFALPVLVGVCVLLLLALLRSLRLVACVLLPVGLGVLGAEGAFGLLGQESNLVVNVAKPLLFVILLASALHVIVAFEHRLIEGETRASAAWGAARDKARGVALALLTTAIGFSSLILAEVIPIRSFGLLSAAGLVAGGPLVLYALPFLLGLFGPTEASPAKKQAGRRIEDLLEAGVGWAERHGRVVVGAAILFIAASVAAIPHLRPSTHTIEYFPRDHPVREAHHALERAGAGLMTLEAVIHGPEIDLRALDAFAATATATKEIRARLDLPLLLREARFRATGSDAVPEPAEAAMYLERRPELERSLRDGDAHRVSFFLRTSSGDDLDRISSDLRRAHAAHLPGTELELTGNYDLIIRSQQSLLDTLIVSLGLTLVLMELVLLLVTRSLRLALVALVPNLVPVATNILLLFALRLPLDVGTAMTGAVALGIAVDDTLHFLVAWREEGTEKAIRRTGRALLLSTVVIAAGFFALVPSQFLPTRNFALLTGAAITSALFADLFVLPPLLRMTAKRAQ